MNYDSTISTDVSMSRVLDEMIVDGSDFDLIVQFLKSHESNIKDIYANSALVYDLYDIGRHPYRAVEPFLVKHIDDLRDTDFLFAVSSLAAFSTANENKDLFLELKDRFHGNTAAAKLIRSGWGGIYGEDKVYTCETSLVDWLNKMEGTHDATRFIAHSLLSLSAFQAFTFLNLNPVTQYTILKGLLEVFSESILRGSRSRDPILTNSIYGDILTGLLRQLLVLNHMEMFNWVLDVLEFNREHYLASSHLQEAVKLSFHDLIPISIFDKVRVSRFLDSDDKDRMSFEEIVFEMNLMGTTFEPYNLFLAIYLGNNYLLKGMKENKELLEFFSLPFDWEDLKWMKDDYKTGTVFHHV